MSEARTSNHGLRRRFLSPRTCLAGCCLLAAGLFVQPVRLCAQAKPSADAHGPEFWVGGEYSNFLADYGPPDRLSGFGVYADWNVGLRWGFEAEARFLLLNGFNGEAQDHYLIGPRFQLMRRGKLRPYAKLLAGLAQNNFPAPVTTGRYIAIAPGGGVDYRIRRRIALRAEYEYQFWPAAPDFVGYPSNGMNPNGFSAGFAYRVSRY